MISTLHIKNIGIIDDLSIDLNEGLNVLTGETGAGKTLIIDSLGIISGGRFSKEMIRKGETNSFVEICMYEPENENSIDGNIIVSREINSNGKNMCKINGRMVTVNELKNFMSKFIEIHGQNDNQSLLDNKFHLKYLDGFIGDKITDIKKQYKEKYEKYLEIKQELKNNYGDEKERERKLDLLRYQFNEIEEANLKVKEEDNLEEKRKLMINSEKISNTASKIEKIEGVEMVRYGEGMIESLLSIFKIVEKILIVIVVSLVLVTAFLIINTIKITIFSRQEEIEIKRLVGASNFSIKQPFVIEGLFIGVLGSIIPVLVTIYGYSVLYEKTGGILFSKFIQLVEPFPFTFEVSLVLVLIGIVVGMIGSSKAVRKYLKI